jgi:hypothetical protein
VSDETAVAASVAHSTRNRGRIVVGTIIISIVLILAGLGQTATGKRELGRIGLYAPSQPYTELYFANPDRRAAVTEGLLPSPVTTRISFVIVNLTHQRLTYTWRLSADGVARVAGHVALGPHDGRTISTSLFRTGCRASNHGSRPVAIRISVDPSHDEIDDLVPCRD